MGFYRQFILNFFLRNSFVGAQFLLLFSKAAPKNKFSFKNIAGNCLYNPIPGNHGYWRKEGKENFEKCESPF